jgi:hypothetical protein
VFIPLYVLAGCLGIADRLHSFGDAGGLGQLGIMVFLLAALVHVLDKLDRMRQAMIAKIDHCVGDVWEAGGRATERRIAYENSRATQRATVHSLVRRP